MTGQIAKQLNYLRRRMALFNLISGALRVSMLVLSVGFIIVLVEGFRYFSPGVRSSLLIFFALFSVLFGFLPILWFLQTRANRLHAYRNDQLAILIGRQYPEIHDELLNVLQLDKLRRATTPGYSSDLINAALERMTQRLSGYDFEKVIPWTKLTKIRRQLVIILIGLALPVFVAPAYFGRALNRLWHATQVYPVELPFRIKSMTGSFDILSGDSVRVVFKCEGHFPKVINLAVRYPEYMQTEELMPDSAGQCEYRLKNQRDDFTYEAFAVNRSPFRAWRCISSGVDTVRVVNRPEVLQVIARITYPVYTRLPDQEQSSNLTEFDVLTGSKLKLDIRTSQPVQKAHLAFASGSILPLLVRATTASGELLVSRDDQFTINVSDANQVTNSNPTKYRIRLQPDGFPLLTLLRPQDDLELTESMEIPIGLRISDDFGFTRLMIKYRLIKKYTETDPAGYQTAFPLKDPNLTLQELYYNWEVGDLGLGPEDAIEFSIAVWDNDAINGPKMNATRTLIARFPSLNELFAATHDQQDDIFNAGAEVLEKLEESKSALEEIARELLKHPEVKWEQKRQIENELQNTKAAAEKIARLGEQLDELIEKSRENQLFSEETISKYNQLQEAFRDILTPELREAMEKLQAAIDKMDAKEIQKALSNFKVSREQFSQELDRLLNIFKRIKIEQNVDELVKRYEDLTRRQENLTARIEQNQDDNSKKLQEFAREQNTIRQDSETAQEFMQNTREEMREFPIMPDEELQQILDDLQEMQLPRQQQQARQALEKSNRSEAQKSARKSADDLAVLKERLKKFQENFQRQTMTEVMQDFRHVINKAMQLSQIQEGLSTKIANTPRQSDQIMDVAVEQHQNAQNLNGLAQDLIELSGKTFGVTPRIGKNLGQASAQMREAVKQMEERNAEFALQNAKSATEALNATALEAMSAMQALQKSGSAAGLEEYLKQLQNLAGQQGGLNDDTQLLGLSGSSSQTAMQRLAARQQQIRQSLEQLQEEARGSNKNAGDLGGIAQDMEEVIRDLQNNQLLRRTFERQQRILSRLLDAQKSLRTQDYKEERQSRTGEDIIRVSPGHLPGSLGERQSVLQQNLEQALRDGYSRDNENVIRRYFEELRQANP